MCNVLKKNEFFFQQSLCRRNYLESYNIISINFEKRCSITYCFSLSTCMIYNIHNYYTEKIIFLQLIRDTSVKKQNNLLVFPLLIFGIVVKLEVLRACDLVTGNYYELTFKSCKVMSSFGCAVCVLWALDPHLVCFCLVSVVPI